MMLGAQLCLEFVYLKPNLQCDYISRKGYEEVVRVTWGHKNGA